MKSKHIGAFLAAAFAFSAGSAALGHMIDDPNDPDAHAMFEELEGSSQWIMQATNVDGGDCCHEHDVIAGIEELGKDAEGRYQVKVPKGMKIYTSVSDPSQFFTMPADKILTIPPSRVITSERARAISKQCVIYGYPKDKCGAPETQNVLFVDPRSLQNTSMNDGAVSLYCYYPVPLHGALEIKSRFAAAYPHLFPDPKDAPPKVKVMFRMDAPAPQ